MKKRKNKLFQSLLHFSIIVFIIFLLFSTLENRFVPTIKEISHMQCKAIANEMIDASVRKTLNEIEVSPLLYFSDKQNGYIANTAQINEFCSHFSFEITSQMSSMQSEEIKIPFGAITGWSYIANKGPDISFNLIPMGSAEVDYDSEFLSAGINQINYKIWLNISLEMKIVNPLYQEKLILKRKIMITDIVFSGKVPEQYVQITPQNEYLLTE